MTDLAQTPILDAETLATLRQAQIPGEPDFIGELVDALVIEAGDPTLRDDFDRWVFDAP